MTVRTAIIERWTGARFLVYALVDPRTKDVRYIGVSSSGLKRPRRHATSTSLRQDTNLHKARWIRRLQSDGLVYIIRVLQECSAQAELPEAEQRWIRHARREAWPLTNLTGGGEGLFGASDETRRKIGALSRARMSDPTFRERVIGARRGKPLPDEWRKKLGDATRGRKRPADVAKKCADAQRGKKRGPLTADWREKVGAGQRGRPKSPEHKAKIAAALRGRKMSPEHRVNLSVAKRSRVGATCKHGHLWTSENTGLTSKGRRFCKTCARDYKRRWRDLRRTARSRGVGT